MIASPWVLPVEAATVELCGFETLAMDWAVMRPPKGSLHLREPGGLRSSTLAKFARRPRGDAADSGQGLSLMRRWSSRARPARVRDWNSRPLVDSFRATAAVPRGRPAKTACGGEEHT